jgi:hypothetical protein
VDTCADCLSRKLSIASAVFVCAEPVIEVTFRIGPLTEVFAHVLDGQICTEPRMSRVSQVGLTPLPRFMTNVFAFGVDMLVRPSGK